MDLKRGFGDEVTDPESHDQANLIGVCWCGGASNLMDLMALVRSSVREEVEDGIKRVLLPFLPFLQIPAFPSRSTAILAESSASSSLQLHFVGILPNMLLTLNPVQGEGASELMVELRDSWGSRVEVGSESSAKIQLVALDGDFNVEDSDRWTDEEFDKFVLSQREGKRPLLVGKCKISLSKGVGIVSDISFTDNSKWIKSGKFRLGARVMKRIPSEVLIRGAVSEAFRVKERRVKSYEKHETPTLRDEIWRLGNIGKKGPIHRRLADKNIHSLKDFLQLYHTNAESLQEILDVPEKKWLEILKNAKSCSLTDDNEHYRYCDVARGVELILDCVFNIVLVTFMGQQSQPYETLDKSFKDLVNKLREFAYEKRSELETFALTNQALVQPQPLIPSGTSFTNTWCTNTQATDKGEQAEQVNSYIPSLQPNTLTYEDRHQMEEPIGHTRDIDWVKYLNLTPEEGNSYGEASDIGNVTSKLKAVCYVTKAAVMFMISIQQDSTAPKKKQKVR